MKLKRTTGRTLATEAENWNECIEKVGRSQDRGAFQSLFKHFSPFLKAFLIKSGGVTPENAEELVQETMIKVWRKAPSYSSSQASASTWIYTIARNTRIDWLRKQNRQNPDLLNAEDLYDERDNPTPLSSLSQIRTKKAYLRTIESITRGAGGSTATDVLSGTVRSTGGQYAGLATWHRQIKSSIGHE
jgi:RNA polymerase sigma-70 factor (ECF subfamily)